MLLYKCKKSVFCVSFLIYFLLGTICGVFAFRCFVPAALKHGNVLCEFLRRPDGGFLGEIFSGLRPMMIVAVFSLLPGGYRAVLPLVLIRAFLISYTCSAVLYYCADFGTYAVIKELSVLPLFYWLCRWVYFRWDFSCRVR